jgi:hypothetical protein
MSSADVPSMATLLANANPNFILFPLIPNPQAE